MAIETIVVNIPAPSRNYVREHTARAQAEQRDGNRQEREVVIKNYRENPGERQLEDQRGQSRETEPEIELRPQNASGGGGV
jgi:hypothetical protein